jgi:hypothetical protein
VSILRHAVEAHSRKTGLTIRQILATAYYKKYSKAMPDRSLDDDVRRWNSGEHNIAYLYDFMIGTHESV